LSVSQYSAYLFFYLLCSGIGILAARVRILKETTSIYNDYSNQIGYISFGYMGLVFADLFYLSVTQTIAKEDRESKKIHNKLGNTCCMYYSRCSSLFPT